MPKASVGRVGFKGGLLAKTDAFLDAHPFGTVPAAFSPDGTIGIFESNSIMRTVARLGAERLQLYGANPYEASRIDSFLDASLVFARDTQIYLLALRDQDFAADIHARAADAFAIYAAGIEQALKPDRAFLVGDRVSLADICFVSEALPVLERASSPPDAPQARTGANSLRQLAPGISRACWPFPVDLSSIRPSHPMFAPICRS